MINIILQANFDSYFLHIWMMHLKIHFIKEKLVNSLLCIILFHLFDQSNADAISLMKSLIKDWLSLLVAIKLSVNIFAEKEICVQQK